MKSLLFLCVTSLCMSMMCVSTRQVMYYDVILRRVRLTVVAVEEATFIKYYKCVFLAVGVQYALCQDRITSSSVACPALQFFPHYLINGMTFGKKKLLNINCGFWFSLQFFPKILILTRNERHITINVRRSSREVSVNVFEKYSNFKYQENPSSWSRVVPCRRTDGQRDKNDEANSAFLNFSEGY